MKQFTITPESNDRRIDRWLMKEMPLLNHGMCQKFFRLKKIRLNGAVAKCDVHVKTGDIVSVYLNDELFEKPEKRDALLSNFHHHLRIAYEDQNILIVDKKPGLMVHGDASEKLNTLVTHVKAYLYQKGEYDSMSEGAFAPAPCNRIDRFTGGLVIFAKNRDALHIMDQKIRDREIEKHYICIINGHVEPESGEINSYILKTPGRRKVQVFDDEKSGGQLSITRYQTIAVNRDMSLLDCELVTGRTHQIRAQFAHIGCPLLGDGQYGDYGDAEVFGRDYQALYAYRLDFVFESDAGPLNNLNGKSIAVHNVPFVRYYFPEAESSI